MPSPQTPKAPEKVTVVPGAGRRVPLRIPGTSITVPAEGRPVVMSIAVRRLVRSGDLVIQEAKAATTTTAASSATSTASPATPAKTDTKEG